jgi:hypothetical protein
VREQDGTSRPLWKWRRIFQFSPEGLYTVRVNHGSRLANTVSVLKPCGGFFPFGKDITEYADRRKRSIETYLGNFVLVYVVTSISISTLKGWAGRNSCAVLNGDGLAT